MTAPSEKLARSLNALHLLQERGVIAIRAADLPRTHRERLVRHGFLQPVMKGWYVTVSPDRSTGDSTAWYASFRSFCAAYLHSRFGARWCLSPEQSLALLSHERDADGGRLAVDRHPGRAARGITWRLSKLRACARRSARSPVSSAGWWAEGDRGRWPEVERDGEGECGRDRYGHVSRTGIGRIFSRMQV